MYQAQRERSKAMRRAYSAWQAAYPEHLTLEADLRLVQGIPGIDPRTVVQSYAGHGRIFSPFARTDTLTLLPNELKRLLRTIDANRMNKQPDTPTDFSARKRPFASHYTTTRKQHISSRLHRLYERKTKAGNDMIQFDFYLPHTRAITACGACTYASNFTVSTRGTTGILRNIKKHKRIDPIRSRGPISFLPLTEITRFNRREIYHTVAMWWLKDSYKCGLVYLRLTRGSDMLYNIIHVRHFRKAPTNHCMPEQTFKGFFPRWRKRHVTNMETHRTRQ
jgi:hypothetical protein